MNGGIGHEAANLSQQGALDATWQTKCSHFAPNVSVTIRSKIRYNGQEYATSAELPPEVRAAYERALHDGAVHKRFVLNGHPIASEVEMRADFCKICDDVMNVIENNGEVTIPNGERAEPWLTKKEVALIALFTGGIIALVIARLVTG